MIESVTKIRVRYSETDKMGYVYYGNYAQYFEIGRVEALRQLGTSYKFMEDNGIMMPVVNLQINYKKPAFYDDELTIITTINTLPTTKMVFYYRIINQNNNLINEGETTLVFIDKISRRPCRCPEWFTEILIKNGLSN